MKSLETVTLFIIIIELSSGHSAILKASIEVKSENIDMKYLVKRLKKFIACTHLSDSNTINHFENNTAIDTYVSYNDSFQVNYDFINDLLTIRSTYYLLKNNTREKVSDVGISIHYKFDQNSNKRIILEDFYGQDGEKVTIDNKSNNIQTTERNKEVNDVCYGIVASLLSPILNLLEPAVISVLHIIVNEILGQAVTIAFEEFYHGRITLQ